MRECRECQKLFEPKDKEQVFCGRHCARIYQARHGIPSTEDTKARFLDGVAKLFDDMVKPK